MSHPAIKRAHRPRVLPDNRILIGLMQYGVAAEIEDDESGSLARLLTLMDGTRDVHELRRDLAATHPQWDLVAVEAAVAQLTAAGYVEDLGAPLPPNLTEREARRYLSAQHFFAWIDSTPRSSPQETQSRIRGSRVALLGLGGTGSTVAASLVASGIGTLHCADFDRVEEANLNRQLIYSERDVGRGKVECALEYLRALNSHVEVTGEELKVESADDLAGFIDGSDVFVLCADEPWDRIQGWANEAALRTGTPWFMSLYTGPMIVVGSFVPGETGCWECLERKQRGPRQAGRWLFDDRPNAVIAGSAGASGHLCAMDVLYHLGGLPTQTRGRVFHQNVAQWDHQYVIDAERDPECPMCSQGPR